MGFHSSSSVWAEAMALPAGMFSCILYHVRGRVGELSFSSFPFPFFFGGHPFFPFVCVPFLWGSCSGYSASGSFVMPLAYQLVGRHCVSEGEQDRMELVFISITALDCPSLDCPTISISIFYIEWLALICWLRNDLARWPICKWHLCWLSGRLCTHVCGATRWSNLLFIQVAPFGGPICDRCKFRIWVHRLATNASVSIRWPNLQLIKVAAYGGQICN